MSFTTTQDAKERVRQAIDIVDLVGSYLTLRRQGRRYVALCPWHDDSRPSLQVNPDRQSWKCWVCDIGGDIFSFVMQQEGIEFREALEMLADRAGISISAAAPQRPSKAGDPNDKKTLFAATAWAQEQFRAYLKHASEAAAARRYLHERGFDEESCARFHLGFSPDSWHWLLDRARSTQFSAAVLEAAGLVGKSASSGKYYDFFRGRVLFPIRDTQSRTVGFGGRVLPELARPDTGKYVNSRETRLFSKSEQLYGLDQARDAVVKSRRAIVVEGYTDVIMAHQCGVKNAVAVLGTALGPRHIRLLKRYADTIILVLDGDEAGQQRTNDVLQLFVAGEVDVRVLTLPQGVDPCDFLRQHGRPGLEPLLDAATDAFDHALAVQTRGVDLLRDTHRANQALEQLLAVVAQAPRLTGATTSAQVLRQRQVLARLAREFRMEEATLRTRLSELRRAAASPPAAAGHAPPAGPRWSRAQLDPQDAELLEILARHPELCDAVLDEIEPELLGSGPARQIYEQYRLVAERGEPAEFARILAQLDEPHVKNLFVQLDEEAQLKEEHAHEDAATRLRHVMDHIRDRSNQTRRRDLLAGLEQRRYDDQEELDVLKELVDQERKRQGIPAPTDG